MSANRSEPNPENFIMKLKQQAANYGFQRSNRYIVIVHGPEVEWISGMPKKNILPLSIDDKKRLALVCNNVNFPSKGYETVQYATIGGSPEIKIPYQSKYGNSITLTLNCSLDMFERKYFAAWNNKIIDPSSYEVELYENYAKPWKILIAFLPPDIGSFENISKTFINSDTEISYSSIGEGKEPHTSSVRGEQPLYFVRLNEVYPVEIQGNTLSYNSKNAIYQQQITLNFKDWDDPVTAYYKHLTKLQTERRNQAELLGINPSSEPIPGGNYAIAGGVQYYPGTYDSIGSTQEKLSPFQQFINIVRDISRYSNPRELKQLIIDQGLGSLNEAFGIENVELVAQAGQVVDVYRQTPNKNFRNTINKLTTPLGNIIPPQIPNL